MVPATNKMSQFTEADPVLEGFDKNRKSWLQGFCEIYSVQHFEQVTSKRYKSHSCRYVLTLQMSVKISLGIQLEISRLENSP